MRPSPVGPSRFPKQVAALVKLKKKQFADVRLAESGKM
jgi:hypothetical protein